MTSDLQQRVSGALPPLLQSREEVCSSPTRALYTPTASSPNGKAIVGGGGRIVPHQQQQQRKQQRKQEEMCETTMHIYMSLPSMEERGAVRPKRGARALLCAFHSSPALSAFSISSPSLPPPLALPAARRHWQNRILSSPPLPSDRGLPGAFALPLSLPLSKQYHGLRLPRARPGRSLRVLSSHDALRYSFTNGGEGGASSAEPCGPARGRGRRCRP